LAGSCLPLFRGIVSTVLLPESFRGGCSFGASPVPDLQERSSLSRHLQDTSLAKKTAIGCLPDRARRCGAAIVGNQHADHAILSGSKEQLAVTAMADMQIGSGRRLAHGLLDQIAK